MRRTWKWLLAALCAATLMTGLGACTPRKTADSSCSVTFNYGYPNAPEAEIVKVNPGEKVAKPADPTRDDYAFEVWYTEAACFHEYDFGSEVNRDLTLFAGWRQTTATVVFYTGAGSSVADAAVAVGSVAAKPNDPSRDGYAFAGWFTEPLCRAGYEYDFTAAVEENLTLYAKWTQTEVTVRLHLYDDVYGDPIRVEIGSLLTAPPAPIRENYVFTAWYADAQRTREFDFTSPMSGDITLYAGWKLTKATITYNLNYPEAGTPETALVDVDTPLTGLLKTPGREGYNFVGWYTDPNCERPFDDAAGVKENTTLYAAWELKKYSVKFDWNFEGSVATTVEVEHGSTIPDIEDIPQNGNKVFVGWTLDPNGEQDFDSNTRITEELTLYAKWMEESSDKIVIRFYWNNGTNDVYKTVEDAKSGRYLDEPTPPTRSGYYFAGWARGNGNGAKWNFKSDRVAGSVDLYAVWLKGYTFEAEFTELDGKYYSGWSNDGFGDHDSFVAYASNYDNCDEMKVSGGVYVYSMLYNGAFLEFNITSDRAVSDAVLVLRLAPDGFDFELDDEKYRVVVNGTDLRYGMLCLPIGDYRTDDMSDRNKPPFVNYLMTEALTLQAGNNVIRLVTNNTNEHGGTFAAETPSVDCITLYSSSVLTWTAGKVHPENVNKTAAEITYAVEYEGNFRTTYDHYEGVPFSVAKVDLWIPEDKEKRL